MVSSESDFEKAKELFLLGLNAFENENYRDAEQFFLGSLKFIPARISTLTNLAATLIKLKKYQTAQEYCLSAIELDPTNPEAWMNLGIVCHHLKRYSEALANYDKALALKPDNAEAHNNRGIVLKELRRLHEALANCEKALALKPDYAEAYNNRGVVLKELRRPDEALTNYEKALALRPDYAEAYNNRGTALKDLRLLDDALASYDKAIALKPDYVEAYNNRGNALVDLKRLDEALSTYDKALELKPDYEFLAGSRLHLRMKFCNWGNFSVEVDRLLKGVLEGKPVTQPFELLGAADSPELHLKASQIYATYQLKRQEVLGPITQPRSPDGKIRIGYYSADFHNHATAYLMAELFEEHDPSRFELYGFTFGPHSDDEMRQRLVAAFDYFFEVGDISDCEVAKLSRELGIDIAVDLKGYTQDSRTGIFAERAAPIQVNYLGYPGTMGSGYFDYVIADKTVIPMERRADFSEKVAYLPNSYQVNDSKRRISDRQFSKHELGLPDKGFVFCCFNNNFKILPATFDSWMRILKAIDGSVLWLLEDNSIAAANLRNEAGKRGVDSNRLIFAKRMPLDEHLARHRYADLFIDTLPYNAHTTTSDALWAGLPVLTCTGKSFASRVAASLLNAIDLPDLITHKQEEFEAKAIELATYPDKLEKVKSKLELNRLTTPLFDTKTFTKHIETAYLAMNDRYQAGLPPDVIEVPNFHVAKIRHDQPMS
ncbi:O-linked N-acetylglucosamine transferase, SPINDLY family protein [Ferribacterium limneticum]|uniref:O-linked N-acetylglucosamine transferase, SPINDLY family protein n=1 Tax=Ferribacterium limneticum TaxID=76259 RepID=UPI001CFAA765|nr:glycosyltransferase family 41 protein [Ferribacterium limneticum]UCV19604.1 tetratricopeptide repeat protein [Ferribacterium limneticum]